jgi:hypothetical protein
MPEGISTWKIVLSAVLAVWVVFGLVSAVQDKVNCNDPRNSALVECVPEEPTPSGPCAGYTDEAAFSNCMDSAEPEFHYDTP